MRTIELLKRCWLGRCLVIALCVLVLIAASPQPAPAATLAEYALLLALITVALTIAIIGFDTPQANTVLNQLQVAVNGAAQANSQGDRPHELSRLSKALGAAEALMGMTSACLTCDELRSTLQQIIGTLSTFKADTIGATGTCHPNGVVQPHEQCDPLAVPTGCPISTVLTFCSDECRCEVIP